MNRGELYRVANPSARDPRKFRVFAIVSRQSVVDSRFSTVICAPVYSACDGLFSQVRIGIESGMKHKCCVYCDELMSLPKAMLTQYVGVLSSDKLTELDHALKVALGIPDIS